MSPTRFQPPYGTCSVWHKCDYCCCFKRRVGECPMSIQLLICMILLVSWEKDFGMLKLKNLNVYVEIPNKKYSNTTWNCGGQKLYKTHALFLSLFLCLSSFSLRSSCVLALTIALQMTSSYRWGLRGQTTTNLDNEGGSSSKCWSSTNMDGQWQQLLTMDVHRRTLWMGMEKRSAVTA